MLRDRALESRFKALRASSLTPFIGRDEELDLLRRRWKRVVSGEGRAVLLSGEPGIGKSRIIHEFNEELKVVDHVHLEYYCTPLHAQSNLYPFKAGIERAAGIKSTDNNHLRLKKIERLWRGASLETRTTEYRVIADVLGIQEGNSEAEEGGVLNNKDVILKVLLQLVVTLSQRKPVFVAVEDAHWIDPTSLELVERTISLISDHRILLLVSSRPEFQPGWLTDSSVTFVSLSRLPKSQGREIIAGLTSGRQLPEDLCLQILSQGDGFPLYLEELTRSILDRGKLIETETGFDLDGAISRLDLPDSLHSSLVERLDRVGSAKKIAQIGAVIGATYELLEKVSAVSRDLLESQIDKLLVSGLIYKRGGSSDAVYVFKHAMVRAAYSTILKSDRQQIHVSVARAIIENFPAVAKSQPEVIAHHFTESQRYADAVDWWFKAGKLAGARFARREAISHLNNGLRLLNEIAPSGSRDKLEYKMQPAIWPNLMACCGPASKDTVSAQERIAELMPPDEALHRRVYVLAIEFLSHCYSGKSVKSKQVAAKLLAAARQSQDLSALSIAYAQLAMVSNFRGKFQQALQHAKEALRNYDKANASTYARRFGWEPSVVASRQKGLAALCLGMLDDARAAYANAIAMADTLDHPNVTIDACCYASLFPAFLARDFEALETYASRCIALAKMHETSSYLVWSYCLGAVALAEQGNIEEAIQSFEKGRSFGVGFQYIGHGNLMRLAGAIVYSRKGDVGQAMEFCETALQASETADESWIDAELWRMKGDLRPEIAEDCYRKGLAIAQAQGASLFALKCATSLARLLKASRREREAVELLRPIHDRFLQGRDSRYVRESQALLEDLSPGAPPRGGGSAPADRPLHSKSGA